MKYDDKQLIVLMAGKATRLYPLTFGFPKSLLSVKQKPAIYNMILPLINNELKKIIFVVNMENKNLLKDFMENSFKNIELDIEYIIQDDFLGPGYALSITRDYIDKDKSVILLLSDTICSYPENFDVSWIGVKKVSEEEKEKYCIIETKNKKILKIIDKPNYKVNSSFAAIGLYYFKNSMLLINILSTKIEKKLGEYQLSSYFDEYKKTESIEIEEINDWKDIGNLENFNQVNKNMFNCRHFNTLYLDELGVLHKKSDYYKISSEINWFKEAEKTDFEKLSPKFYNNQKFDNEYAIEYYDYLTLSEYFTFYPLLDYNKKIIFQSLVSKLMDIYKSNQIVSLTFKDLLKKMLIEKTEKRIGDWDRNDLSNIDKISINEVEYIGLRKSLKILNNAIDTICESSTKHISIIHGDIAFSNILFSPRNMIFKFIDPRGNFGIDTIYGDYRYDLAKLRHCYHGRYDEIINDLFIVKEYNSKKFLLNFYRDFDYQIFDDILMENKINIDDVELIEALLFISMIPLHKDYPNRQLAFFLQGIKILNNQIKKRGLYE